MIGPVLGVNGGLPARGVLRALVMCGEDLEIRSAEEPARSEAIATETATVHHLVDRGSMDPQDLGRLYKADKVGSLDIG